MDPSQHNDHEEYTLEETANTNVKALCKKFADTFLKDKKANEFVLELFDPKHAQSIEWLDDHTARAKIGKKNLQTKFIEYGGIVFLEFSIDDEFTLTGRGDANQVFATVIQAVKEYVKMWSGVHTFVFTAKEQSRARMYDALAKRVSSQLGWHVVPYDDMQADPKYRYAREHGEYVFAIEKGIAPEHRQAAQKPQHEKFKSIWYVGSTEDKTLPVFRVNGGEGWEAEQFVMRTRSEYKGFHPLSMYSKRNLPAGQEVIDLGDYKPPYKSPPQDPNSLGARLRAKLDTLQNENFADGKNPQDKGDSKRHGINTKASVSSLRKTAKQGGRKGQLAHWLANMKAGKKK
jgi:hypothetical protein